MSDVLCNKKPQRRQFLLIIIAQLAEKSHIYWSLNKH